MYSIVLRSSFAAQAVTGWWCDCISLLVSALHACQLRNEGCDAVETMGVLA